MTIYTSNPADPGVAGFILALSINLGLEVALKPLSEMPAPDRQRPTRQQLLTERAELAECLSSIEHLLAQAQRNPLAFPGQLALLRQDRDKHLARRQQISRLLGEAPAGVEL